MNNSLIYNFDEVLKNVRKIGNTFYWECPICGWYLDEKADVEGQEEPRNFETIETIAKDPLCANCRKNNENYLVSEEYINIYNIPSDVTHIWWFNK